MFINANWEFGKSSGDEVTMRVITANIYIHIFFS